MRIPSRRRTFWRVLAFGFVCSLVGFGSIILTRRPSNRRPWIADHARAPEVVFSDSLVRIANLRNFHPVGVDSFIPAYETRTYDLRRLNSAWFVLAPFSQAWRGPAHGFVSFGFDDSSYVTISVEARREVGETYGVLAGLGRNFELIYVVGDERDVIGRRAAFGDVDVYLYPIRTTPERARAVFVDMLRRADALSATPEFYHTVRNNCMSNLVASVNRVVPNRIDAGLRLLLPGYADEIARSLGLLEEGVPIDQIRTRYRINEAAARYLDSADFSRRIRS